jgi:hypothetical protein
MFTTPHKKEGLTPPTVPPDNVLVELMLLRVESNLLFFVRDYKHSNLYLAIPIFFCPTTVSMELKL